MSNYLGSSKMDKLQEDIEIRHDVLNQTHKEEEDEPPFWGKNPNILFDKSYILEFFPVENMTYEQKMNAISRLVIFLTVIGFIITYNFNLLVISFIILAFIFVLYGYQKKEFQRKAYLENFDEKNNTPAIKALRQSGIDVPYFEDVFDKPSENNPLSNVLITDYDYNPDKKPAAPSYNENVKTDILQQAKQLVNNLNPSQPNIADKLFRGLGEELEFEQSMRQFTSNPSTTIPNDQKAFAEFCYGEMISSKEGNMFSLARNLSRHTGN